MKSAKCSLLCIIMTIMIGIEMSSNQIINISTEISQLPSELQSTVFSFLHFNNDKLINLYIWNKDKRVILSQIIHNKVDHFTFDECMRLNKHFISNVNTTELTDYDESLRVAMLNQTTQIAAESMAKKAIVTQIREPFSFHKCVVSFDKEFQQNYHLLKQLKINISGFIKIPSGSKQLLLISQSNEGLHTLDVFEIENKNQLLLISLIGNSFTEVTFKTFGKTLHCSNIKCVTIEDNPIHGIIDINNFGCLVQIERLCFRDLQYLDGVQNIPSILEQLIIEKVGWNSLNVFNFTMESKHQSQLTSLGLADNEFVECTYDNFGNIVEGLKIENLFLQRNPINGILDLNEMRLYELQCLFVDGCTHLEGIRNIPPTMKELYLLKNNILSPKKLHFTAANETKLKYVQLTEQLLTHSAREEFKEWGKQMCVPGEDCIDMF